MRLRALIILLACMPLAGCSGTRTVATAERTQVVYVVRRAWHSGVAISAADWSRRDPAFLSSFPGARYLEFGWGDAAYYQADEPTSGMAVASLWPSATVMEVVPLQDIPAQAADDYEAVALQVSQAELEALVAAVEKSFVQPVDPTGKTYRSSAGEARFYHARGKFHAFRTCNRWTSELLKLAGCTVRPALIVTSGQVIGAAKRCGAPNQRELADRTSRGG